jgi:hypothetical protein
VIDLREVIRMIDHREGQGGGGADRAAHAEARVELLDLVDGIELAGRVDGLGRSGDELDLRWNRSVLPMFRVMPDRRRSAAV